MIAMLEAQIEDGATMTDDDRTKLASLNQERKECLKPVRIRITSSDKTNSAR